METQVREWLRVPEAADLLGISRARRSAGARLLLSFVAVWR
jgi:hypothetical protein